METALFVEWFCRNFDEPLNSSFPCYDKLRKNINKKNRNKTIRAGPLDALRWMQRTVIVISYSAIIIRCHARNSELKQCQIHCISRVSATACRRRIVEVKRRNTHRDAPIRRKHDAVQRAMFFLFLFYGKLIQMEYSLGLQESSVIVRVPESRGEPKFYIRLF